MVQPLSVLQILTVRSCEAVATKRLSGEKLAV
jgi:hypothetical protein